MGEGTLLQKGPSPTTHYSPTMHLSPQKYFTRTCRNVRLRAGPDETVVQSDYEGRVELPAGNANELFGVTPCNASVFAHFPLDFLGVGEQSFMDFFGETVGIDFLMASGDAVEDFLGH